MAAFIDLPPRLSSIARASARLEAIGQRLQFKTPSARTFRSPAPCRSAGQWLNVAWFRETGMLALIKTIDLALYLYWWIIIASAIFSWLYAFNVVNPRNQFVGTIGNMLFRLTEPALQADPPFLAWTSAASTFRRSFFS